MIGKFLDTFFRHKLLILLPPVLIPLIVGPIALMMAPVYYETWTGVWVERPTYLTYNDESWNKYITPAQNQSRRLGELLQTRTFLLDVAKRTPLAPLVGSIKGEEKIQEIIGKGLAMFPNTNHLLGLRFRAETPQLAFQISNALIETFKERAATDRVSQAGLAISFYEARLEGAEEELAKANDAVRRYVAANPRLTALDPGRGAATTAASRLGLPPAAIEPQLAEMLRRLELQQGDAERARAALEQARLDASASLEGQELGFQVVDPPQMPQTTIRERRRMLLYPAAGLLVGLGLSAVLLVLLVATDRSVRSEADLAPIARVVGVVPRLRHPSISKGVGPDAARRAIGFVAGAALPAPQGSR